MSELNQSNAGREITVKSKYESPEQFKEIVASIAAELKIVAEKAKLIRSQGGIQKFFNKSKNIDFLSEYVEALAKLQTKTLLLNFMSQTQISEMKKDHKKILSHMNNLKQESLQNEYEDAEALQIQSELFDNVTYLLESSFEKEHEKDKLKQENLELKKEINELRGNMEFYISAIAKENNMKLKISKKANPANIWRGLAVIGFIALIGIFV